MRIVGAMLINSRIVSSILFGFVLLTGSAWAAGLTVQGDVKGPDGKPINGADVRIERKDAKAPVGAAKTNQHGEYVFKGLALGTYTVAVNASGMASTAAEKVRPREEGAVRINFNLQVQTGNAQAGVAVKKKPKHMVWMAAQTGTNIGGRWVEVDDSGNLEAGADNGVQRGNAAALSKMQGGASRSTGN
jgi:hypothetical protein